MSFRSICAHSWLVLLAAAYAGCTDDTPETFTPSTPTLGLVGAGPCGEAFLPVTPEAVLNDPEPRIPFTVVLTATGIDQRTATGDLSPGTRAVFYIEDEAEFFGGFVSNLGVGVEGDPQPFSGKIAQDQFFCFEPGVVRVKARTAEPYRPGGEGDAVDLTTRTFPIQCLTLEDFQRRCAMAEVDGDLPDGVLPPSDAMVATDGEQPDAGEAPPPSLSLQFVPPDGGGELIIGIRDSGLGRPDSILLRFLVTNRGMPVENAEVTFSLPEISPPNVAIDPRVVTTGPDGLAEVRLLAGGTAGVVSVRAEARYLGEVDIERSPPVIIRAGIPSQVGFFLHCNDPIIPAFTSRLSASRWLFGSGVVDGTDCAVQLVDRINGRADPGLQVFFLSEAGSVTQASSTDNEGVAISRLRIGPPAPFNTAPLDYERLSGYDGTFNPRDGLVRLVAVTRGEEDFVDVNGDKIFEEGVDYQEAEMDLPEPFVDVDDNGERDEDERRVIEEFRDSNDNGVWDEANDQWDSDTEIWTSTTVLWVGNYDAQASQETILCDVNDNHCCRSGDPCVAQVGAVAPECRGLANFYLQQGGDLVIGVRFADRNGNCLDGYESGSLSVETEGPIAVFGNQGDVASGCFALVDEAGAVREQPTAINERTVLVGQGRPEFPLAPLHIFRIRDASGEEEASPQLSRFSLVVAHTEVGGDAVTHTFNYTICR